MQRSSCFRLRSSTGPNVLIVIRASSRLWRRVGGHGGDVPPSGLRAAREAAGGLALELGELAFDLALRGQRSQLAVELALLPRLERPRRDQLVHGCGSGLQ